MEVWGRCDGCDRWFYCPGDEGDRWRCPVCGTEPELIEQREPA